MNPLGKKIEPIPVPEVDEYERFKGIHGTPMIRNKRTGAIETDMMPKGPQYAPYVPTSIPVTTEQWDAMIAGAIQTQEDDGFPVAFWGVM